jgi:hypothetical protein
MISSIGRYFVNPDPERNAVNKAVHLINMVTYPSGIDFYIPSTHIWQTWEIGTDHEHIAASATRCHNQLWHARLDSLHGHS